MAEVRQFGKVPPNPRFGNSQVFSSLFYFPERRRCRYWCAGIRQRIRAIHERRNSLMQQSGITKGEQAARVEFDSCSSLLSALNPARTRKGILGSVGLIPDS